MAFDQVSERTCPQNRNSTANAALFRMRLRREGPVVVESSACENEKIILFNSENGICNLTIVAAGRLVAGATNQWSLRAMLVDERRVDARSNRTAPFARFPVEKGSFRKNEVPPDTSCGGDWK
jgi:hypothetical protein